MRCRSLGRWGGMSRLPDTSAITMLADGAKWLWEEQRKHQTRAHGVLDIPLVGQVGQVEHFHQGGRVKAHQESCHGLRVLLHPHIVVGEDGVLLTGQWSEVGLPRRLASVCRCGRHQSDKPGFFCTEW